MFNLEGKNAFVSGASRGLGRQFANALAKAGANIVIVLSARNDKARNRSSWTGIEIEMSS